MQHFARLQTAFAPACATLSATRQKKPHGPRDLSQEQRLALKAAMHEDVQTLAAAARTQAMDTPKQFCSAALLADAGECERGV